MKLSQLYSNKPFKRIKFNNGLNVILAKVTNPSDYKIDSHNLGKTTLITVIDFCLLKQINNDHIFKKHLDKFIDYEFFLEVKLNSGAYLTIKRSVNNNSKISFKKHMLKHQDFTYEDKWDQENLPFQKAIEYLNEVLDFDVLKNWTFRKSVSYFLRNQFDFKEIFQLSKFSRGADKEWKPFMFDLLGFNGQLLLTKYELDSNKKKLEELIENFKTQFSVDVDEIDKIKGAIVLKSQELEELDKEIDNFDFYNKERSITRSLVEQIERNIAELNSKEYDLEMEINSIQESLNQNIKFNIDEVKKIYNEVKVYFPDSLVNDYKQLEEFNKSVTEERNKYLKERLTTLLNELNTVRAELEVQNKTRIKNVSYITSKDTLEKYKVYQTEKIKISSEIVRLEEKLKSINQIGSTNLKIKDIDEKIAKLVEIIINEINSPEIKLYPKIRTNFSKYIKAITNISAYIYIKPNSANNVDFQEVVQGNLDGELTAEGKGTSYRKFLSIAFDLAVITSYRDRSFFRFIYHDGALEGLDNRKKTNFIELIQELCSKYDIQYIFSTIEDDLPNDNFGNKINFKSEEIPLILDDSGDKGKLFMMTF